MKRDKSGFTTIVTRSIRKPLLRSVYVTFPHVGPGGTPYHFEMTSFKEGPVELYRQDSDGLMQYYGTVRDYAPGKTLRQAFREVWYAHQPSKAARAAFEASAADRPWEKPESNQRDPADQTKASIEKKIGYEIVHRWYRPKSGAPRFGWIALEPSGDRYLGSTLAEVVWSHARPDDPEELKLAERALKAGRRAPRHSGVKRGRRKN